MGEIMGSWKVGENVQVGYPRKDYGVVDLHGFYCPLRLCNYGWMVDMAYYALLLALQYKVIAGLPRMDCWGSFVKRG